MKSDAKSMEKASKTEARIHEKSTKNVMRIRTGSRDAPIGTEWTEPAPEGDPGTPGTGHRGAPRAPAGHPCPGPYSPVIYIAIPLFLQRV